MISGRTRTAGSIASSYSVSKCRRESGLRRHAAGIPVTGLITEHGVVEANPGALGQLRTRIGRGTLRGLAADVVRWVTQRIERGLG